MGTKLNIKKPCPENWESMKIGLNSRFCDNCQKKVIDFTNKDKKEILEYLLINRSHNVCGRIHRAQLDFSNTDLLITIQAITKQTKNTNIPFYLLTIGAMLLASCDNNLNQNQVSTFQDKIVIHSDTNKREIEKDNEPKDTQKKIEHEKIVPPIIPINMLVGEIEISHDTMVSKTEPYFIVDIMPEFKGGIDSLYSFVNQNLKYPDWEKENNIEGRIIVSFIIDKSGKIKEPKIIRTVKGSKNFDNEVIRVINKMPDWTPGKLNGNNVDVQFNLPINFKL